MSLRRAEFRGNTPDDNDPGATVMWFGIYKGKRLDELDLRYRRKLIEFYHETPSPNLVRFKDLNERYEASLLEREHGEPGATKIWFGMHKGTRLDQLEERYRREIVHCAKERKTDDLVAFKDLHDRYLAWLDERRSPLSTIIWFGKFRGHEVRVLYQAPRRWAWLIQNCGKWREDLLDIQKRYIAWKAERPRRKQYAPRACREITNPVGEKLGLQDDEVASDADEPYHSDDGFIVSDGHVSTDAEDSEYDDEDLLDSEDERGSGARLDELLADLREDNAEPEQDGDQGQQLLWLRQKGGGLDAEGQDKDTMFRDFRKSATQSRTLSEGSGGSLLSLSELFTTPICPEQTPNTRRLQTREQSKQHSRKSAVLDSDSDLELPATKRNAGSQSPRKRRISTIVIGDSSSDSDTPLISPSKRRRQEPRQRPSISGDSSDDRPLIPPHKLKRQG